MRIELHTHTTCSDGRLRPRDVVRRAASAGVAQLSITDHDTIAGFEEAARAAAEAGINLVPGIELTARVQRSEVHVLGYFIDPRSPLLAEFLRRLRDGFAERVSPEDAARLIREGGGVPVLAHPCRYGDLCRVEALLTESFGGLEAYRPEHTPRQTLAFLDLARRRGVVASGGSDFHGNGTDRVDVGGLYVPPQVVDELRRACPAPRGEPAREVP